MFLLFLSFYEATDRRMNGEAIDEIIADLYGRLRFLNGVMNINRPWFLRMLRKYLYKSYQKYSDKVAEKRKNGEWLGIPYRTMQEWELERRAISPKPRTFFRRRRSRFFRSLSGSFALNWDFAITRTRSQRTSHSRKNIRDIYSKRREDILQFFSETKVFLESREGNAMNENEKEIEDLIKMIDGKMEEGVGRLKVNFTEGQDAGTVKEQHHLGRCDVGSPWAKGTVTNCDAIDYTKL